MAKETQQRLMQWFGAFAPEHPVVFVTCVADVREMAEPLRDVGKFDRFLVLPTPTMAEYGRLFVARLGAERCGASILAHRARSG